MGPMKIPSVKMKLKIKAPGGGALAQRLIGAAAAAVPQRPMAAPARGLDIKRGGLLQRDRVGGR